MVLMDVGRGFLICNVQVRILKLLCRMTLGKRVQSEAEHKFSQSHPAEKFQNPTSTFQIKKCLFYIH